MTLYYLLFALICGDKVKPMVTAGYKERGAAMLAYGDFTPPVGCRVTGAVILKTP